MYWNYFYNDVCFLLLFLRVIFQKTLFGVVKRYSSIDLKLNTGGRYTYYRKVIFEFNRSSPDKRETQVNNIKEL